VLILLQFRNLIFRFRIFYYQQNEHFSSFSTLFNNSKKSNQ